MREVVLCFLDIESNMLRSSWLNSWAARLAPKSHTQRPPQVHVELFFRSDNDSNEGYCTSIVYNKKIHWFRKKFSRQWSFRSLWMEDNVYAKLKAFCLQHVGCGFNKVGFFLLGLGIRFPGSFSSIFGFRQRFFCSEYISAALLHCELLPPNTPRVIHPQKLYEIIAPISSITTVKHYGANEISYDI
jgi:hypothetical protein